MTRKPLFRSIQSKIIVWTFIPTALILSAVALVTFLAYQQVAENLAIERDRYYTDLSAVQLSTRLKDEYQGLLSEYAGILAHSIAEVAGTNSAEAVQRALLVARPRLEPFDGGVLVLNNNGTVIAATPERQGVIDEYWGDRDYFRQMLRSPAPIFTDVVLDGSDQNEVIVIALPITGDQGQFLGLLAGMLRVDSTSLNSFSRLFLELQESERRRHYLIDGNGSVIYHDNPSEILEDYSDQPIVQQVLSGQTGGTVLETPDGQTVLAGYAPVPGTNWGLVTETDWGELLSATQRYGPIFVALLLLGMLIPGVVVAVMARQITKPVTQLTQATQQVAQGEFGDLIEVNTGDEIEELASNFNRMSLQLQETYGQLEQRLLERQQAEENMRNLAKRLAALNQASQVVTASLDTHQILAEIVSLAGELVPSDFISVLLVDDENRLGASAENLQDVVSLDMRIREHGLTDWIVCTRDAVVIDMIDKDGLITPKLGEGAPLYANPHVVEIGVKSVAGLPLIAKERLLGVLYLQSLRPSAYRGQLDLLTTFANQTAIAIENARLHEQVQRHRDELEERVIVATQEIRQRADELAMLYGVSRAMIASRDLEALLQAIVHNVAEALPADRATLILIDIETQQVPWFAKAGPGAENIVDVSYDELWQGLSGWVLREREPTLSPKGVPDPRESPEVQQHRSETDCGAIIVVPLFYGDKPLGTMTAINRPDESDFSQQDIELMTALANQAASAIENARLYAETAQRAEELAVLYEVGRDLVATLDLDALLPTISERVTAALEADRCAVFLFDEAAGVLRAQAAHGYMAGRLAALSYRPGEEIVGQAYAAGKPQYVPDLEQVPDLLKRDEIRAVLAVPLVSPAAGSLGVLSVTSLRPDAFTPNQEQLLETMAGQIAGAIENARLYEAAQEADHLKSAFLATMSHELRTPLNSIIGFTGILLQGLVGPLNAEQTKQLGMVQNSARHLLDLITDVLDISKIEAGQLKVAPEPMDMRMAIEKAVQTVTPLAEKKGLTLVAEMAPEVGQIVSDRRRVEQILINLLNNAVKFTDEGHVSVQSSVISNQRLKDHYPNHAGRALMTDNWLLITIRDTGIGIKPEDMGVLFEPFRQVDTGISRKREGTGLGLSICKKLVEMLGGEIWVESEWGVGSTFMFTLPLDLSLRGTK